MRSRALVTLALVLGLVASSRRLSRAHEAAAPLGCGSVVAVEDESGVRLACASDAALAACGPVRAGTRYRGCEAVGVVRGPLLAARGQPVELNRATVDDLRALPGVGPGLARRLVKARDESPLCGEADLDRVPGIGPKRAGALSAKVSFEHPLCPAAAAQ